MSVARTFQLLPRRRFVGVSFGRQRSLRRGPGSDVVWGGAGRDMIRGASGFDLCRGAPASRRFGCEDRGGSRVEAREAPGDGADVRRFARLQRARPSAPLPYAP